MTRRQKRLDRIRQNPKHVRFEDLRKVLEDYGFVLRNVEGSHYTFVVYIAGRKVKFTVPFRKPHVRLAYVRQALALIEQIEEDSPDE